MNFSIFLVCREYIFPRDDKVSQPKGWIRGNTRIGPILEVTTRFQHFKYGIVRIEFREQRQFSFLGQIFLQSISTTLHRVMHNICEMHGRDIKIRYFKVDIDFGIREGLMFDQTRSNANYSSRNTSSPLHCES